MTRLLLLLLALSLALFTSAWAQRVTLGDGLRAAVLRMDEARVYAMQAADIGALDDLLTPDCLYVHSNGVVQTKPEFLAALRSGQMRYASLRYTARPLVRLFGTEAAVVTGTMQAEVAAEGRTHQLTVLITAVYVLKDARWQLASYQSTTAPSAK